MKISEIPFVTTDWSSVPAERYAGDVGEAIWRTQYFGPEETRIRVRMVEYSPGYVADHWCSKGHIILCLEGEMETTLEDGRVMPLKAGMSVSGRRWRGGAPLPDEDGRQALHRRLISRGRSHCPYSPAHRAAR